MVQQIIFTNAKSMYTKSINTSHNTIYSYLLDMNGLAADLAGDLDTYPGEAIGENPPPLGERYPPLAYGDIAGVAPPHSENCPYIGVDPNKSPTGGVCNNLAIGVASPEKFLGLYLPSFTSPINSLSTTSCSLV